jgi:hypothetical protein
LANLNWEGCMGSSQWHRGTWELNTGANGRRIQWKGIRMEEERKRQMSTGRYFTRHTSARDCTREPSQLAQSVTLMLSIQELCGSNLGQDTALLIQVYGGFLSHSTRIL